MDGKRTLQKVRSVSNSSYGGVCGEWIIEYIETTRRSQFVDQNSSSTDFRLWLLIQVPGHSFRSSLPVCNRAVSLVPTAPPSKQTPQHHTKHWFCTMGRSSSSEAKCRCTRRGRHDRSWANVGDTPLCRTQTGI